MQKSNFDALSQNADIDQMLRHTLGMIAQETNIKDIISRLNILSKETE